MATEWLFSVPEHVLEKHLAADPGTPTNGADPDSPEDHRVTLPRRVPLQVRASLHKHPLQSQAYQSHRSLHRQSALRCTLLSHSSIA